jgi:hypothetical protein
MTVPRDRRLRSPAWLAALLSAAGCAAPPPAAPPAATTPPAAAPTAATASTTAAAPLWREAPVAMVAPPLAEPLPPLTRPVRPVHLFQAKSGVVFVPDGEPVRPEWASLPPPRIASIHGRSPGDVWLLTVDENVLHLDGRRIVDRFHRVCGWGGSDGVAGTRVGRIVADADAVHVFGQSRDAFSRLGGDLTATLTASAPGKWSCATQDIAPVLTATSGDHTWRLAHNLAGGACRLRALGGPCAPIPQWAPSFQEPSGDAIDSGIHSRFLWMRGFAEGWIVTWDEEGRSWLLRYNGAAWLPVAVLEKGTMAIDLWADEGGWPWILARRGGEWGQPGNAVFRFDGEALRGVPVPESFAARHVRGTGARDVWFLGAAGQAYQWDGDRLHQGPSPINEGEAWSSPGGEVWIAGEHGAARTAPLGEAGTAPLGAARTAPLGEAR